jgi:hypothetical protein
MGSEAPASAWAGAVSPGRCADDTNVRVEGWGEGTGDAP